MSDQPVIRIESLRKEFRLSTSGAASLKTALLWWKRRQIQNLEVLKGISFDVAPGECVAVVGRNGAGKSTLLSLMARVYKPSSGKITIQGRVAPLLELGAGFHPDLSGYENITFNAMIMGLSKKEATAKIDDIIAFSELRDHIYAPTRTYSSGMMARLGFAIAVHVDAQVLIVDEVLAVGDYDFEKKCNARLKQFREGGGTILFVSHNTASIRQIADRVVWLHHGLIRDIGDPERVIHAYETTPLDRQVH